MSRTNGGAPPAQATELGGLNERLARIERRVDEIQRSSAAHTAEVEEVTSRAAHTIAAAEAGLARKQRRQELKLARQERDRKIEQAEQRIAERSATVLAAIEREGAVSEQRVRAARGHAEDALASSAGDVLTQLQERIGELRDTESRLTALLDQIAAAAERARGADERTAAAEQRLVAVERAAVR